MWVAIRVMQYGLIVIYNFRITKVFVISKNASDGGQKCRMGLGHESLVRRRSGGG